MLMLVMMMAGVLSMLMLMSIVLLVSGCGAQRRVGRG